MSPADTFQAQAIRWFRRTAGLAAAVLVTSGCAGLVGLDEDYVVGGTGAGAAGASGGSGGTGATAGTGGSGGTGAAAGTGGTTDAGGAGGAAGSGGQPCPGAGTVYDAFDQFSASSNPTPGGRWWYGSTAGAGETVDVYEEPFTEYGLSIWRHTSQTDPNVIKNGTGTEFTHPSVNVRFPAADFLHVHPAPNGDYSLVRWVAPFSASYRIDATFNSLNLDGATTDVHVAHGAAILFDGAIESAADVETFSQVVALQANDRIDFLVGDGGNGYACDSTGVQATLTVVCP